MTNTTFNNNRNCTTTSSSVAEVAEVEYSVDGASRVGVITLNAPRRRNAFTETMAKQFKNLVNKIQADYIKGRQEEEEEGRGKGKGKGGGPRALVLRGKGKSFCAGAHLGLLNDIATQDDIEGNARRLTELYSSFLCIRKLDIPVVAALHGHCVGGGAGIAIGAADLRIAAPDTILRFNFVKELGIHPGMATTSLLPKLVGGAFATQMLLQVPHKDVSSTRARELGILLDVVEDPFSKAMSVATELAAANPVAMSSLLKTLRSSSEHMQDLERVLVTEGKQQALSFASPVTRAIFSNKRIPPKL